MSLYNMLFGVNKYALPLLTALDLDPANIPRFRDCFLEKDSIVVLTRTGGGNREHYLEENKVMQDHPNYLYDEDEDFDCTYASFHFSFPDKHKADLMVLATLVNTPTPE